jgi:hypothetical protein
MRTDCKHYESRTYGNGEAVRKCVLDLAPEAPWACPADCPSYARKLIDAGWQYGSLAPKKEEHVEPPPRLDADVARLLDEAEDIVNSAGFELMAEEDRKAKRKLFRKQQNSKNQKKRKR